MAGALRIFRVAESFWCGGQRGEESLNSVLGLADNLVIRRRLYNSAVTRGR
jgi:hypothetical protein